MRTVYDEILNYLPPFIAKHLGERLMGTVTVASGTSTAIVGSGTGFARELAEGDTIIVWGDNSDVNCMEFTVSTVTNDTNLVVESYEGGDGDSALYYAKVYNEDAAGFFTAIIAHLEHLHTNLSGNLREDRYALLQFCKERGLYPGRWEDDDQLAAYLETVFTVHERRATEGENMDDEDDDSIGILGECDRLANSNNTDTPGAVTTITEPSHIGWILDITYPDYTTGVTADNLTPGSHVHADVYDPAESACFLDVLDMIIITIYNNNPNYTDNEIRNIVANKLVPLGVRTRVVMS